MKFWNRIQGKYRRAAAAFLNRRPFTLVNRQPLISFTFDDFPSSALHTGGGILEACGVRGTYYASLGLMGKQAPTGQIFVPDELPLVFQRGHELGCHTYAHCHAYDTPPAEFERSVLENRQALKALAPAASMPTLSYPISVPHPDTKRRCSQHFAGCRAGGQTFNHGLTDLNSLKAFFLEQSRDDLPVVKAVIEANARAGGWLIFATHDVCDRPTRYGCVPNFFEAVVKYSVASGAGVMPVFEAFQKSSADVMNS